MPNINIDSIIDKVAAYSRGSGMKGKVKDDVAQRLGSMLANRMVEILIDTASEYDLPQSVMDHFNSLYYGGVHKLDGRSYCITIKFDGDLSRMSLLSDKGKRKGERTGDGINDIVLLFNNGYSAGGYVYGIWDSVGFSIRSRKDRPALNFLDEAIVKFETEHRAYDAYAYVVENGI